jgi:nitronate monooxygenase
LEDRKMPDPLRTPLCDMLGIKVPILLAPMANGPSTPELAAAVSRAGGLGCLAATGLTCEIVERQMRQARALAEGAPIAVNVQSATTRAPQTTRALVERWLAPLHERLGALPDVPPAADPPADLISAALDSGASAVSVALGDPGPLASLAREAGVPLIASASSVAEAMHAVAAGAEVVVAQGAEAGGHRTTFDVDGGPLPLVGTISLVPRIVDAVSVPVLAAGGIMDGRGLAAALMLGSQGVWLGTRFMTALEAGSTPAQRELLVRLDDTSTFVSEAVSGRPARWVRNELTGRMDAGPGHLGWPGQRAAFGPLLQAGTTSGDPELMPLLAGQGAGMAHDAEPAAEIVAAIADQARSLLRRHGDR